MHAVIIACNATYINQVNSALHNYNYTNSQIIMHKKVVTKMKIIAIINLCLKNVKIMHVYILSNKKTHPKKPK